MKFSDKAEDLSAFTGPSSAVTIGVFDGVHLGHRKVISRLIRTRREIGLSSAVLVTFDRHPLSVTHPDKAPPLLTTLEEKKGILREFDLDVVVIDRFNPGYAALNYTEFIREKLLGRLNMSHLVVGYDFRFGKDRTGSLEMIREQGMRSSFEVTVVPPAYVGGQIVSSTRIREQLLRGDTEMASERLTRDYFFDAEVVRGESIGRQISFPTANLVVKESSKLIPRSGVYAVMVETEGGRYGGMMNIGTAPTIKNTGGIEVHIFDFSGDLYGSTIRVYCRKNLREEKKFASRDQLREQLETDARRARRVLAMPGR
ncbi:MAG: bifunctional riboflavin kinase/FAD synthetase [Candidatus Latescibacteria bacterium]|nr:bifunctional riboflavin kinase/FAD synthetase [bacterium]MBD3424567.1 bifunctional riboflavin kinase/FAD synthetase [Candidatus Latescibacterota bacterium]